MDLLMDLEQVHQQLDLLKVCARFSFFLSYVTLLRLPQGHVSLIPDLNVPLSWVMPATIRRPLVAAKPHRTFRFT